MKAVSMVVARFIVGRARCCMIIHAALGLAAATQAFAQQCSTCRIRSIPIATIGAADGPGIVGDLAGQAIDASGKYWFTFTNPGLRTEVRVFHPSGKLLKIVGRAGRGPGEFTFARNLDARAGRVYAFDVVQRTISEYDTAFNLVGVRMFAGTLGDAVVIAPGVFAVNAIWDTRERAGHAVHIYGRGPVISVDQDVDGYRFDLPFSGRRALTATGRRTFWSARKDQYVITEFDSAGNTLRTLRREVPWLKPETGSMLLDLEQPPQNFISSIREDSRGRLW